MPLKSRNSWWRVALWLAVGLVLLGVFTLLVPLPEWRTGRQPAAPLTVVPGDQFSSPAQRIWIDTDAACGTGPRADSDDCLAILLLTGAPQLQWAGVSTVFGNAPLEVTDRTTRALLAALSASRPMPAAHAGAAEPSAVVDAADRAAARALREALQQGRLTIVALGPADQHRRCPAGSPGPAAARRAGGGGHGPALRPSVPPCRRSAGCDAPRPWSGVQRSQPRLRPARGSGGR